MKLAILSDIHSNILALKAVISEAEKRGCEHFLTLGDIVGYYYNSVEVVCELKRISATHISGNHDRYFCESLDDTSVDDWYYEKYGSSLRIAKREMQNEDILWLKSLPSQTSYFHGLASIEMCHGSPNDKDEYVYPDCSLERLENCTMHDRNFVLMGHTHYPFSKVLKSGTVLLNPGSVGQARERGGEAQWCELDSENLVFRFHRTPYDPREIIEQVRSIDPHLPYLENVLTRCI